MRFVWDPAKAAGNEQKHGVSFYEASTAFADPFAVYEADARYAQRGNLIGTSTSQHLLFVVHIEILGEDVIRIISARQANRNERRRYEE